MFHRPASRWSLASCAVLISGALVVGCASEAGSGSPRAAAGDTNASSAGVGSPQPLAGASAPMASGGSVAIATGGTTSNVGAAGAAGSSAAGTSGGMTGQLTGGLGAMATGGAASGGSGNVATGGTASNAGAGGTGASGTGASGMGAAGAGASGMGASGMGASGIGASGMGAAGTGPMDCDTSPPPSSVAAWIDESWDAEGRNNILNRSAWLFDAAMKGDGEINICVRWGASQSASAELRDQIAPVMEQWFNEWFSRLYPYDCFPYEHVRVNLTGWAVRPGQESLVEWSDGSLPIYTDQESGSDPPGEPKCPDACGFFFNWDHDFSQCPGGEANHFDYSLWLDDALPGGGAAAVGGDWGLRMPLSGFLNALNGPSSHVILHEIGHGFGLSDYYSWNGSRPEGGSLMIVGSSMGGGPTLGDQWILRRYWSEAKADRY